MCRLIKSGYYGPILTQFPTSLPVIQLNLMDDAREREIETEMEKATSAQNSTTFSPNHEKYVTEYVIVVVEQMSIKLTYNDTHTHAFVRIYVLPTLCRAVFGYKVVVKRKSNLCLVSRHHIMKAATSPRHTSSIAVRITTTPGLMHCTGINFHPGCSEWKK